MGAAKAAKKQDEVMAKMMKIQEVNKMKQSHIEDRQKTAKKNQEQLSQMIQQVNELQKSGQMQPFLLANSFLQNDESRLSAAEEEKKQNISLRPSAMPMGHQSLHGVDEMEEMGMDDREQTFNNDSFVEQQSQGGAASNKRKHFSSKQFPTFQ